jgi:hypothetical protein
VLVAQLDNFLQIILLHHLTSRIAWIDNNNSARDSAIFDCTLYLILNCLFIHRPAGFFVQIIWNQFSAEQFQES